ncbi:hypothetical protein HHL16_18730 [Pseudoflavitalea sp. G-6-1-2]|uniref:hypothetical protein n=1 Tax=Pseudoflavitalea sp. G-6-1-2 TaxID=2728841 RepID=UPI00146E1D57|nr:hypothetical protein [Pseudoflavitalea sp. G-6-1-2]NML22920.1 hypothetical protein [Pseudoflavitalea sp. G-6-1-2]
MKKLLIILIATVITSTMASAMPAPGPGWHGGGWHRGGYYRPRTIIWGGGFYNPWYSPWGYGFYPDYGYRPSPPSKLDLQIEGIRVNYADKIKSVRMNRDFTREERRNEIRDLKTQRSNAILDAKKNFYKY